MNSIFWLSNAFSCYTDSLPILNYVSFVSISDSSSVILFFRVSFVVFSSKRNYEIYFYFYCKDFLSYWRIISDSILFYWLFFCKISVISSFLY